MSWEIAKLTFKQLLGEKFQRAMLVLSLISLAGYPVVAELSMFEIKENVALFFLNMVTLYVVLFLLLSVFVIMNQDIGEKKIIYLFSLPISAAGYISGRITGIILFLLSFQVVYVILSLPFLLIYHAFAFRYLFHLLLLNVEMLLLLNVSFFLFSLFDSPILMLFTATGSYVIGVNIKDARDFLYQSVKGVSELTKAIMDFLYYTLPNFSIFDYKLALVYRLNIGISWIYAVFYGIVYSIILFGFSVYFLKKREFY